MANVPIQHTHFSAGIRWQAKSVDGEILIRFLVILYTEPDRPGVIKFPGGTDKLYLEETPLETLAREYREEVLKEGAQGLRSAPKEPVCKIYKGPNHTQHFFLLDDHDLPFVEEDIRSEPLIERKEGRPDEHLGPPQWMTEQELDKKIFQGHRPAFEKACEWIREEMKRRQAREED